MKLLIIPDIHTHHEKADRIIKKYENTHKFIFMGDYFDQFNDTPEMNEATAGWLKYCMDKHSDWIFLRGNHDEMYDPRISVKCSGFSRQKKEAINQVLSIEDWDKLKYFHYENKCWFSHAGITKYWFQNPIKNTIDVDSVQKIIDDAVIKQRSNETVNAIWSADHYRGGGSEVGGILWCDWRNLDLIPNFKQVVGHTPIERIQTISDNNTNSVIINVDCSSSVYMSEILQIDEKGYCEVLNTSYV